MRSEKGEEQYEITFLTFNEDTRICNLFLLYNCILTYPYPYINLQKGSFGSTIWRKRRLKVNSPRGSLKVHSPRGSPQGCK